VDGLGGCADRQPAPTPLLFTSDEALLFVCRFGKQLSQAFRFAIADSDTVETMVHKARFAALAERLGLRAPRTRVVEPWSAAPPADVSRDVFPLLVKPDRRVAR